MAKVTNYITVECDSDDLLVRAEKFADTILNTAPTTSYDQQRRDINTFEVIQDLIERIRELEKKGGK